MELIFVRHGETVANTNNWFYGFTDSPVTPKGRKQAKAAGILIHRLAFQPDSIFVSERTRTHETLSLMGFDLSGAVIDSRINEQNMGDFECMTYQEIADRYPNAFEAWNSDFDNYQPRGGESHLEFSSRVHTFMDELIARERDRNRKILIVSHGGVMHSVYTYINRNKRDTYYSVYFDNAAVMRAKLLNDRLVIDALYNPGEIVRAFKD